MLPVTAVLVVSILLVARGVMFGLAGRREFVGLSRAFISTSPHLLSRLRVLLGIPTQLARGGLSAARLGLGATRVGFGLGGEFFLLGGGNAIPLGLRAQFFGAETLLLELARAALSRHEQGDDHDGDDGQDDHDDDDELILFHAANARPAGAARSSR